MIQKLWSKTTIGLLALFHFDHPAVAVELKVVMPIAYPLGQTLNLAYFITKLLRISETVI